MNSNDAETIRAYVAGVDQAARDSDTKWGVDRLPLIVGDELRAKFYRQAASWRTALGEAYNSQMLTRDQLTAVQTKAAAMQRAYAALDQAAEEAGHRPIAPWVWEAPLKDGAVAAIVQTNTEASKVIADGRHVVVYTLAEIANVIDGLGALHLAKQTFPGAKVMPPVDRSWVKTGDEIPFG